MKPVQQFISTILPAMAVLWLLCASPAQAGEPRIGSRFVRIAGDSIELSYALPEAATKAPAILVLHDRFGMRTHVQSTLRVLATVGYRAFALALRSAPMAEMSAYPAASLDSNDIGVVAQVAVELMNDSACSGRVGLLGFDVGAAVAAEVIARLPFFKACVLFYPSGGTSTLARLPFTPTPILLGVAYDDSECSLADVGVVREVFIDQGRTLDVRHFKDTKRFFFNPDHENYHVDAMKLAWKELVRFFNRRL